MSTENCRYAALKGLLDFLRALQSRTLTNEEYGQMVEKLDDARFLFRKDFKDWMWGLFPKTRRLNNAKLTLQDERNGERHKSEVAHQRMVSAGQEYAELSMWLDQEMGMLSARFAPYFEISQSA